MTGVFRVALVATSSMCWFADPRVGEIKPVGLGFGI